MIIMSQFHHMRPPLRIWEGWAQNAWSPGVDVDSEKLIRKNPRTLVKSSWFLVKFSFKPGLHLISSHFFWLLPFNNSYDSLSCDKKVTCEHQVPSQTWAKFHGRAAGRVLGIPRGIWRTRTRSGGHFRWIFVRYGNDHMIDMQIKGWWSNNKPSIFWWFIHVCTIHVMVYCSGWFTIALVAWHHVGTMWIFSKSSTQTDADPQELSYLERLWSYLSKQLWRFEKNPPVIIQMCTWQFPVCSWFSSWFSHQNLHLWYHLLGIVHCHVWSPGDILKPQSTFQTISTYPLVNIQKTMENHNF